MFIFRYPSYSSAALRDLQKAAMREAHNYFYNITTQYNTPEEDDSMEQSKTQQKWTVAFPGISPERVQVKLKSDRRSVEIIVDGTVQKVILPPVTRLLKQEDLSVAMEHGLLTLYVRTDVEEPKTQEDSYIPVNGKQFLQEGK